jgi:hypothetical protein
MISSRACSVEGINRSLYNYPDFAHPRYSILQVSAYFYLSAENFLDLSIQAVDISKAA